MAMEKSTLEFRAGNVYELNTGVDRRNATRAVYIGATKNLLTGIEYHDFAYPCKADPSTQIIVKSIDKQHFITDGAGIVQIIGLDRPLTPFTIQVIDCRRERKKYIELSRMLEEAGRKLN